MEFNNNYFATMFSDSHILDSVGDKIELVLSLGTTRDLSKETVDNWCFRYLLESYRL